MHTSFALTLVVNHACNLRCSYCYTGEKIRRPMSPEMGRKSIDRAITAIALTYAAYPVASERTSHFLPVAAIA